MIAHQTRSCFAWLGSVSRSGNIILAATLEPLSQLAKQLQTTDNGYQQQQHDDKQTLPNSSTFNHWPATLHCFALRFIGAAGAFRFLRILYPAAVEPQVADLRPESQSCYY